jgi:hypothetical protein
MTLQPTRLYYSYSSPRYLIISKVQFNLKCISEKKNRRLRAACYGATNGATQIWARSKGTESRKRNTEDVRKLCASPMHPCITAVQKCAKNLEMEHQRSLTADNGTIWTDRLLAVPEYEVATISFSID